MLGREDVALTMLDSAVRAVAELVAVGVNEVTLFGVVLGALTAPLDVEGAEGRTVLLVEVGVTGEALDEAEVTEVLTDSADTVLVLG